MLYTVHTKQANTNVLQTYFFLLCDGVKPSSVSAVIFFFFLVLLRHFLPILQGRQDRCYQNNRVIEKCGSVGLWPQGNKTSQTASP